MQNYLYCFDNNYNIQATCSMYSLITNNTEQLNIYIIHKEPNSFTKYQKRLEKLKNLNELKLYNFNSVNKSFPNIEKTHVSEATYYRFYLNQYLPKYVKEVMYIDADIVCINDLAKSYRESLKKLKEENYTISAITEKNKLQDSNVDVVDEKNDFDRLGLKSDRYFNAGVMLIDVEKWKLENVHKNLLETQIKIKEKILFWDQDVLNFLFDGSFSELDKNLNYDLSININNEMEYEGDIAFTEIDKNKVKLLHYSGKSKPWTVKGVLHPHSDFYHSVYYELFRKRYHIQNNWKKLAINQFLTLLTKNKIKHIKRPVSFIFSFFRYLIKK
jgi:UDP-glucose:(galactosyl)LPS alpha-1,2-glucosyltransferase